MERVCTTGVCSEDSTGAGCRGEPGILLIHTWGMTEEWREPGLQKLLFAGPESRLFRLSSE